MTYGVIIVTARSTQEPFGETLLEIVFRGSQISIDDVVVVGELLRTRGYSVTYYGIENPP